MRKFDNSNIRYQVIKFVQCLALTLWYTTFLFIVVIWNYRWDEFKILNIYVRSYFRMKCVLNDCMYIIIKFLLDSIFVTMIIFVTCYTHPIVSTRLLVLWNLHLLCCALRYTSLMGMLQKIHPFWRAYPFTFTYFPIWILKLPRRVQW